MSLLVNRKAIPSKQAISCNHDLIHVQTITWESYLYQWPFQDPELEVHTIYKAYVRPM